MRCDARSLVCERLKLGQGLGSDRVKGPGGMVGGLAGRLGRLC